MLKLKYVRPSVYFRHTHTYRECVAATYRTLLCSTAAFQPPNAAQWQDGKLLNGAENCVILYNMRSKGGCGRGEGRAGSDTETEQR